MKHLNEDQLTLAYFREAGSEERAHLENCAECRAALDRLATFLDALRAAPVVEPPAHYEQRLWGAIAPKVRETLARRRSGFRFWMLAPVLAGVAAIAFALGMFVQRGLHPGTPGISPRARERVLLIALGDHLDRSQMVLAELVNAPEAKTADISEEQHMASELVGENRILRQTAARRGDAASAAVLEELERVLLEIAHSPDEVSKEQLDDLRQRIEAQGLLFKIRIIGTNAKEKGMKL